MAAKKPASTPIPTQDRTQPRQATYTDNRDIPTATQVGHSDVAGEDNNSIPHSEYEKIPQVAYQQNPVSSRSLPQSTLFIPSNPEELSLQEFLEHYQNMLSTIPLP